MKRTLVIAMVAVVAVVLFAHDVPLAAHLHQVERDRLVTSLERDAFVIAGMAESDVHDQPVNQGSPAETSRSAAQLMSTIKRYQATENVRVVIVDQAGVGFMTSDGEDVGDRFLNRPEIVEALAGQPAAGARFSTTLDANLFYVAVPIFSPEGPVGAVRLTALDDEVNQRADARVRGIFLVAGLSLLMAIAVAWVVAGRLSKPIETLRRTTQRVADGDLSARADDEGPPEVRALADSLNTMTARLAMSIERQRAFAGTASHQLRTPLTALRLRLEALSDEIDATGPGRRSVDAALVETDRLHRMIEGLLALARAEATAASEVANVSSIVTERVEQWSPLADEHDVAIESRVDSAVGAVDVVPGALEQILDNLIDNALGVAPPGSTIHLNASVASADTETTSGTNTSASSSHGSIELHVIDEGPGLDAVEREQAFERFWRGTASSQGGTGLGLAIVRQLAEASGGRAELRQAAGGGVDATIILRRSLADVRST